MGVGVTTEEEVHHWQEEEKAKEYNKVPKLGKRPKIVQCHKQNKT